MRRLLTANWSILTNRRRSPIFLYSVHVLVTFALGKHRAIDRSADPKGKLQLTIF
jgi:hypothetical protein